MKPIHVSRSGLALAAVLLVILSAACRAAAAQAPAHPRAPAYPDDLTHFAAMAASARERARATSPDPVLRQVDVDVAGDRRVFRFVDRAATQEIAVSDDEVHVTRVSKLVGTVRPGLDVSALRIGPKGAVAATSAHWEGCAPMLTLFDRRWYVFCQTTRGVVTATIDAVSGEFRPSDAPPALPPPTATPR
jgi:hypothetical protein